MNDLVRSSQTNTSVFANETRFELAQRQAKALASSTIIPREFQGNMSNCLIALELASRLDLSPFVVLQNLHVIHGRPSFGSSFMIALINSSGRYPQKLQFKLSGEGDARQCIAWTKDVNGNIQEGPPISIRIAKNEGWYARNGSKWPTMPDLMLMYRSAAFFGRLYAPELSLGMQTYEELQDVPVEVRDITPPNGSAKSQNINEAISNVNSNDQETVEISPQNEGGTEETEVLQDTGKSLGPDDKGQEEVPPKTKPTVDEVINHMRTRRTDEALNKSYARALSYDWSDDDADLITVAKTECAAVLNSRKNFTEQLDKEENGNA